MKYFYVIIGLCLVYVLFSYARFLFILKNNQLVVINQTEQSLGQGQKIVYVAGGDSTAVGVGASTVEQTYTYKLAQNFSELYKVEYYNFAVSGAKTEDVINFQLDKIISKNPDIITLSIGANDVTHLKSNEQIIENFKVIVNSLVTKTQAQIYLTNIPILDQAPLLPYPFRLMMKAKAVVIGKELSKLETDRVHIVPIHTFGWSNYPDIKETFAKDQFHPSDLGYENWTQAYLSTIKIN